MKKNFGFYLFLALALVWGVVFYWLIALGMNGIRSIYLQYKYPLRFEEQILKYSKEFNLEPSFVSAVIYEESRFRPYSSSHRGAIGLMQLLPDTADYIARKLKDDSYNSAKIADIDQNIRYGCYYLSYLFDYYADWDKVLAAYNAGEGNVNQWIKEGDYEVKFEETRNFVERVKATEAVYKKLYFSD